MFPCWCANMVVVDRQDGAICRLTRRREGAKEGVSRRGRGGRRGSRGGAPRDMLLRVASSFFVFPAKAGIQELDRASAALGSRFRGKDK